MIPESQPIDGSASAPGGIAAAGCDRSNPAASVTVLAAVRLLAVFNTLFSPACTMYSLPIRTIE
jgi:hypothetical protein